jgi:hypothetical protein
MEIKSVNNALVGKYFLGVHDDAWMSGVVEAAVDDAHYLVRFNDVVRFTDGSAWPEALAVVAISDMARAGRNGNDDIPPPWLFFDSEEKQRAYESWLNEPAPDRKPRIVPLRPTNA